MSSDLARNWRRASRINLEFRPITDRDLPFLARVYASTRIEELAHVPWSDEQRAAFLHMQFDAQHAHYQTHYTGADWLVIEFAGESIGRLYVARWPREHRLIDIALLPAFRGRGFATALLQDLQDEAQSAQKSLSIHVEKNNPAMRLYRRLGFAAVGEHGVYDLMRWMPAGGV
jgi:ribosomal protein S18 acetylase RimI-like enzyme